MATIAQKQLFRWDQIEALGDLARLKLVLDNLPDEALMKNTLPDCAARAVEERKKWKYKRLRNRRKKRTNPLLREK
jgi:hypothetical protein